MEDGLTEVGIEAMRNKMVSNGDALRITGEDGGEDVEVRACILRSTNGQDVHSSGGRRGIPWVTGDGSEKDESESL